MHNLSLLVLFASLTARAALVGRAPLRSPAAATRLSRLAGPPLLQLPDIGSLVSKLRGEQSSEIAQLGAEDSAMGEVNTDDLEFIPRVLVIGATGRTGTIVVRKLVLRGFRVSVLVRSLSTETLTRLGGNVQYSYGDILDYQSLLDAMEDVDKVVFAASAGITAQGDPATEEAGIRNILRALQDTRTFSYGAAEATKLSLFKFRRDADFDAWQLQPADDDLGARLAAAGLSSARRAVAYWKRSDAHPNGVFVGTVYDTYLGAAVVQCSFLDAAAAEGGGVAGRRVRLA